MWLPYGVRFTLEKRRRGGEENDTVVIDEHPTMLEADRFWVRFIL
jgi:hypothetical protein